MHTVTPSSLKTCLVAVTCALQSYTVFLQSISLLGIVWASAQRESRDKIVGNDIIGRMVIPRGVFDRELRYLNKSLL